MKMTAIRSILWVCTLFFAVGAHASQTLRNLVSVEGVRENQLMGYGLVLGLNGSGDTTHGTTSGVACASGSSTADPCSGSGGRWCR